MSGDLFAPFQLNDLTLANRVVMAPMTRKRADEAGVATPMMEIYYQQRASAGLIITESAPVSAEAVGYPRTPGLFTDRQAASWLRVTDAVHSAGGRIFAQLEHCGRDIPSKPAARRRDPGCAVGVAPHGAGRHLLRDAGLCDAACARDKRNARDRRAVSA
jgi:2,4-dienoyl-CoA reductase-like NADH-dependent reductase (Old Yellow Enzyme family)